MSKTETWVQAAGWEGCYEVSTLGNIRSIQRTSECGLGLKRTYSAKTLKRIVASNGYLVVNLTGDGKRRQVLLHRLILTSFMGEPLAGQQACHNNGDRGDCSLSNLRWDSAKANHADKKRHGTWQGGVANGNAKLSEDLVREIRASSESGLKLSKRIGHSHSNILRIRNGQSWKHV